MLYNITSFRMYYLLICRTIILFCCVFNSVADSDGFEEPEVVSSFCGVGQKKCDISIPKNDDDTCKSERQKNIEESRKYYKLTKEGEKRIIKFPLENIPFLNQTMEKVNFHTATHVIDSKWASKFLGLNGAVQGIAMQMMSLYKNTSFTEKQHYIDAFNTHKEAIKAADRPEIFANPSLDSTFTEFLEKEHYLSDEMFVQQRLAGLCPFSLRLVTKKGNAGFKWDDLKKLLNKDFSFDEALQKVLEDKQASLTKAMESEQLYMLYHESINGIDTVKDFFLKGDEQTLIHVTSPISLFVRTGSGDLKAFAIQTDYKSDSPAYSPFSDIYDWNLAKKMVDSSDLNVCQAIWHLSHVHLSSGVYCTIFRSHFSKLHPIHEIMQHHCEGTTPHISTSYGALVSPESFGSKLFSISDKGFVNLTLAGYNEFRYETLAYDHVMSSRGLDQKHIKYYPFRDDGEVLWKALKKFAYSFTKMYYETNDAVKEDWELQSFAAQISSDGGKEDPYGGRGNIVNFPNSFKNRKDVKTFITRFLWQIVIHGAVNYPLEPWASFVPLGPSKLYKETSGERKSIYHSFPDTKTTIGTTTFTSLLGNVRINRMFDYYSGIEDEKLSKLVKRYHKLFNNCIQKKLEKRNAERRKNGLMGFQYFEPKWITNSVHV